MSPLTTMQHQSKLHGTALKDMLLSKHFAIAGILLSVLSPFSLAQRSLAQDYVRKETTIYYQGNVPMRQETTIYRYDGSAQVRPAPAPANTPLTTALTNADEVTDYPQRFIGRTISMRAEVDRVYGPNSMRIKNGELVILSDQQLPTGLTNDDKVIIVGELRPATTVEMQRNPSLFGRTSGTYMAGNSRYVMRAREVRILENDD